MDDLWVVLPHLGAGGAQKVGLLAAAHFAEQGLKVRVLSLRRDHPVKHVLPKGVEVFDLVGRGAASSRSEAVWPRPSKWIFSAFSGSCSTENQRLAIVYFPPRTFWPE